MFSPQDQQVMGVSVCSEDECEAVERRNGVQGFVGRQGELLDWHGKWSKEAMVGEFLMGKEVKRRCTVLR